MLYKLTSGATILGPVEGRSFLPALDNCDYQAYLAWLAEGNTPEPADMPTPDQTKAAQWDAIKADRDKRTQTGGYYVAPHWYHSDTFSRTQQIGLVMLGANIPAGTLWKTLDNGLIAMTPALAGQIFGAAAVSDIAIFAAAEAHKATMLASADSAAYDFSGGWPAMYEAAL